MIPKDTLKVLRFVLGNRRKLDPNKWHDAYIVVTGGAAAAFTVGCEIAILALVDLPDGWYSLEGLPVDGPPDNIAEIVLRCTPRFIDLAFNQSLWVDRIEEGSVSGDKNVHRKFSNRFPDSMVVIEDRYKVYSKYAQVSPCRSFALVGLTFTPLNQKVNS